MRTTTRKHQQHAHARSFVEVGALKGRRTTNAAPNSLQFLARVEGVEVDGHVRGANGMRWRVA